MSGSHLLLQLYIPDRYESLYERLGGDLVRVLVDPPSSVGTTFQTISQSIGSRGRGLLLPVWADSGTGKSTLANSLGYFYPALFSGSASHYGEITEHALTETCRSVQAELHPSDDRTIPIVVDGREGAAPNDGEMASIKRFLRQPKHGARSAILWLETGRDRASGIAERYEQVSGKAPVDLPISLSGPSRQSWPSIARETMRLSNSISDLESLGVDPVDYDTALFSTLGDLLARISDDFNELKRRMLSELEKPTRLLILFASESRESGPLAEFTEGRRLGLLNAHALIGATPGTDEGKWWAQRVGLLTSTIVRLEARSYVLPPTLTVSALRRYGTDETKALLRDAQVQPANVSDYWSRSDVGRALLGDDRQVRETRGNPGDQKRNAFGVLVDKGLLSGGGDKLLNDGIGQSLQDFVNVSDGLAGAVHVEMKLVTGGPDIIPDIRIEEGAMRTCVEIAWRKGEFATTGRRADMAGYILRKLRAYARSLGWTVD